MLPPVRASTSADGGTLPPRLFYLPPSLQVLQLLHQQQQQLLLLPLLPPLLLVKRCHLDYCLHFNFATRQDCRRCHLYLLNTQCQLDYCFSATFKLGQQLLPHLVPLAKSVSSTCVSPPSPIKLLHLGQQLLPHQLLRLQSHLCCCLSLQNLPHLS